MAKTRRHRQYGGKKFYKGSPSKTHRGDLDFTGKKGLKSKTHRGDMDFTGKKGLKSKTHRGDMDFTTKYGDKVFHRKGKYVKIPGNVPYYTDRKEK
jgi:hypothetical protein